MVAAALVCPVGAEVPVLTLAGVLVLNDLLSGSHDAVLAEVVVGSCSVLICDGLLSGQHLTFGVESVSLGVNGKQLDAVFCMVGLAVLKIEAVGLILLA